ncbi:uncharacterized protein LOC108904606 [Anoplophora glabripennis]|uniref:uncharacterized protein LOC108904606 n=1 Tax=Anoplophora glabripennis TaxID=217634 RepID=UPI0008741AAE|nr:uncharacterized protein LOC108904606 [Anoplophora glabripennis]
MASFCTKQLLLAIATLLFLGKRTQSAASPKYLLDIERFEPCTEFNDTESPLENVKFLKINRTARAFFYDTTLKRPLDENIGLKAELEKWGSRGWIQVPFMALQPDACNLFRKLLGKMWVDLGAAMGAKEPGKCPLPAGRYSMKNFMYDTSDLGYFAPFKGKFRYKAILTDMKTGKAVQCITVVINVTDAA